MDAPTIDRVEQVVQPADPGGIARTWLVVHGHHEDGSPYVGGHRTYREHAGEPPWGVKAEARKSERARAKVAYRHPPPLAPQRVAEPAELPRGAKALLKAAEAAGWACRASYANGFTPPQWRDDPTDVGEREPDQETGELPERRRLWCGRPAESYVVAGRHRDGRRFVATWEQKTTKPGFDSKLAIELTENDTQSVNVTTLKKWITS